MAISWRLTLALAKASCCCFFSIVVVNVWFVSHGHSAVGTQKKPPRPGVYCAGGGSKGERGATVKRLERWQFRESPHNTWQRWQLTELALNGYADVAVAVAVGVDVEVEADVGAFWPCCLPLRGDRQRHLTASLAGDARQRQRNFLSVWLLLLLCCCYVVAVVVMLLLLLLLLLCWLVQWNVTNRVSVTEIKRLRVWQINWHDQVQPLAPTLPPTPPPPPLCHSQPRHSH